MSGPARRRSTLVLLGGAAIAVVVGAAAALLRPQPAPPGPPSNLGIPVLASTGDEGPRVRQERMLEELIQDAATAEWPERLPAFAAFRLLVESDPSGLGWVVDRLAEPQVPDRLAIAFAADLSTRQRSLDGAVFRLIVPRLEAQDPGRVAPAMDVLRASGRTRVAAFPPCHCGYGLYPSEPPAGGPAWLLAFSLDGGGLRWNPETAAAGVGWVLNVERASVADGPPVLVRRIDAVPEGAWLVEPEAGAPGLRFGTGGAD